MDSNSSSPTPNAARDLEAVANEATRSDDASVHITSVHITDAEPHRAHDFSDLTNAVLALVGAILLALFSLYLHGVTSGVEEDAHTVGDLLNDWLFALPLSFLQQATMVVITISVVVQMLSHREWWQTVISMLGFLAGIAAAIAVSQLITVIDYQPLIDSLRSASHVQYLFPELSAGLTAFLTCAGPRRSRSTLGWSWNTMFTVSALLVMLSANSFVSMAIALLLGRMVGLIIRYAVGSPSFGVWGEDLVDAARSVGLEPESIQYRGDTSTRGTLQVPGAPSAYSADDDLTYNSRRYLVITRSGERYTASVADTQRHSQNYLRQLWQWLKLTGLSLRHDRSVVDMTHHHFLMLLALRDAGLSAVGPYAVADSHESSVLFLHENANIQQVSFDEFTQLSEADAVSVLSYLDAAHQRGITHRHISPNALARETDHLILCGWENGDLASSATNIAADRVQILILLSALLGIDTTLSAAQKVWDKATLSSVAPYIQNVLIPSSVRELAGWSRTLSKEVRSRLIAVTTSEDTEPDTVELVALSRFNVRNFITAFLIVVALSVILTQLNIRAVVESVQNANPVFALVSLLAGCASWFGTSLTLATYMDREKRDYLGIFMSQVAQSFAAVSMPAGVGPAFVNLRFLRKTGHKNTAATAAMSAVVAVQFATTFLLMVALGMFTGNNGLTGLVPTGTLAVLLGVVALGIALSMLVPPVRQFILVKLLPRVKNFARQFILLLTQPGKVALGALGSVFQNLMLGLSFWAALQAFNMPASFIETTFIFLVANTIGSAAPTPGGLGGVETSLTVAFTGVGIPSAVALSAALLFRVMTYWIRIPLGALAMSWLGRKNLI
ncbi:hypothetical protein B9G54_02935 [Alloscardovia macacae]|uniref:TIGR00374 family protein n=1 Tax=Alloscardovia macacae TaxID=1160091 RepID=A0A1Y2SX45_9BIFI|nr:lysylphosphatidylglycerol synthase transmembrane domain-containing protein [Alloscardovia macacae]OTA27000.1 hypothetical protein B9G54_02935 [Alloscardovia macacae]OTA30013.1 hypothetical protein B9T39_01215 [Alloscardovia macacae]